MLLTSNTTEAIIDWSSWVNESTEQWKTLSELDEVEQLAYWDVIDAENKIDNDFGIDTI